MANLVVNGTSGDDIFRVLQYGQTMEWFAGLGTDTVDFNQTVYNRNNYTITKDALGVIHLDSVAGASNYHLTLHDVERLTFDSGRTIVDLTAMFPSDATPPTVATFSPVDGATGVSVSSNIVVTFSEAVQFGTGLIEIRSGSATGAVVVSYNVATPGTNLSISGSTLTINPTNDLASSTDYFVTFASGAIKDLAGNSYAGTTTYDFITSLDGTVGNDILVGTSGNDYINGLAGDDLITGGAGNDVIDGGVGLDTAEYTLTRSSYGISTTGGVTTVAALSGTDGTDSLTNLEKLQFSDMSVDLTMPTEAAKISTANLMLLEELYVAFFNRVPDASGLRYWIDSLAGGQSIDSIADAFYAAGIQYSAITGYSSSMTNTDFINKVYANVLARPSGADAGGLAYWNNALDTGTTRGGLVKTILDAAQTYINDPTWSWVPHLLNNKIAVADYFAVQKGLTYNTPQDSITNGVAIAAAIMPADTTAAIALIGLHDPVV